MNKTKEIEIEKELRKDKKKIWKYNKPGIYCIKLKGKIVYIGKSLNMLKRLSQHIVEIQNEHPRNHKYVILRAAMLQGIPIDFDVLQKCYGHSFDELNDALRRC